MRALARRAQVCIQKGTACSFCIHTSSARGRRGTQCREQLPTRSARHLLRLLARKGAPCCMTTGTLHAALGGGARRGAARRAPAICNSPRQILGRPKAQPPTDGPNCAAMCAARGLPLDARCYGCSYAAPQGSRAGRVMSAREGAPGDHKSAAARSAGASTGEQQGLHGCPIMGAPPGDE